MVVWRCVWLWAVGVLIRNSGRQFDDLVELTKRFLIACIITRRTWQGIFCSLRLLLLIFTMKQKGNKRRNHDCCSAKLHAPSSIRPYTPRCKLRFCSSFDVYYLRNKSESYKQLDDQFFFDFPPSLKNFNPTSLFGHSTDAGDGIQKIGMRYTIRTRGINKKTNRCKNEQSE